MKPWEIKPKLFSMRTKCLNHHQQQIPEESRILVFSAILANEHFQHSKVHEHSSALHAVEVLLNYRFRINNLSILKLIHLMIKTSFLSNLCHTKVGVELRLQQPWWEMGVQCV